MSECNIRGCQSGLSTTVYRHAQCDGMFVFGKVCAQCARTIDDIRAKIYAPTVRIPLVAEQEVSDGK